MSSIDETRSTITGLGRFAGAIHETAKTITGFFGFRAVMLFLAVMFVSMGLAQIGIPPGLPTFGGALVIVNAVWLAWLRSFDQGAGGYAGAMLSANAMVLAPVLAVLALKFVVPRALRRLWPALASLSFVRRRAARRSSLAAILADYQRASGAFSSQLTRDILAGGPDEVVLSPETKKTLDEIHSIVEKTRSLYRQ